MSTQVWSDDACKESLDLYLRTAGAGLDGAKVCLFKTNLTPDHTTTLAALLAAEATFPGYARLTLSYANWPAATVTAHVAHSLYGITLSWTCTGGGSAELAYGFFVIDAGATIWRIADRFAAGPYNMLNAGDNISGGLTLTSQSHN